MKTLKITLFTSSLVLLIGVIFCLSVLSKRDGRERAIRFLPPSEWGFDRIIACGRNFSSEESKFVFIEYSESYSWGPETSKQTTVKEGKEKTP